MRVLGVLLVLGLIVLWLFFPIFFQWWAVDFWIVPDSQTDEFMKLGPIGDIYGSLNTFISSIALCAVAYTTKLQYDASKEVRKESFRNIFFDMLERNRRAIESIALNNECTPTKYFGEFSNSFTKYLKYNEAEISQMDFEAAKEKLRAGLRDTVECKENKSLTDGFYTAFKSYKLLLRLVKNEKQLSKDEKSFYFEVIQSSMYYGEKKALFWLALTTSNDEYKQCLKDTYLLDLQVKDESTDTPERKAKKARIIRLAKQLGLDKTAFKSSDAIK